MEIETVSVAQLKAGLSAYLAKVRSGTTTIAITSHRKEIARVVGVAGMRPLDLPLGLAQLVADGTLKPGNGTPLTLDLPLPLQLSNNGLSVSEMAIHDRGPR